MTISASQRNKIFNGGHRYETTSYIIILFYDKNLVENTLLTGMLSECTIFRLQKQNFGGGGQTPQGPPPPSHSRNQDPLDSSVRRTVKHYCASAGIINMLLKEHNLCPQEYLLPVDTLYCRNGFKCYQEKNSQNQSSPHRFNKYIFYIYLFRQRRMTFLCYSKCTYDQFYRRTIQSNKKISV